MTEQRYGYTYHRVLVDSTRILDPQFDDAVIYVTGAQLELLRNMTQYLNRLSTYVSEYQPDYYLSPTVEDYDDILAIVADLESVLMGNPNTIWGYADRWYEAKDSTSVGDASTDVLSTAVPAGYIHVLEAWQIVHYGLVPCGIAVYADAVANDLRMYTAPALASGVDAVQFPNVTMKEGDRVRFRVTNLPNGTKSYLRLWGYKMVVPE